MNKLEEFMELLEYRIAFATEPHIISFLSYTLEELKDVQKQFEDECGNTWFTRDDLDYEIEVMQNYHDKENEKMSEEIKKLKEIISTLESFNNTYKLKLIK